MNTKDYAKVKSKSEYFKKSSNYEIIFTIMTQNKRANTANLIKMISKNFFFDELHTSCSQKNKNRANYNYQLSIFFVYFKSRVFLYFVKFFIDVSLIRRKAQ